VIDTTITQLSITRLPALLVRASSLGLPQKRALSIGKCGRRCCSILEMIAVHVDGGDASIVTENIRRGAGSH
jgi:hypothetical protein